MIAPPNDRPGITYEDALAGYLEDGMSQESAEAFARVLTNPPIPGLPII